jgi:hypothetical protein
MDRERLNTLLLEPTAVDATDVAGLRELAGRYPWFSGAQVLLTVGEAATGGVLYDEHLRQVAAHLPSRAQVHDLVHADAGPTPRQRSTPVDAGPLTVPVALEPVVSAPVPEASETHREAPSNEPDAAEPATPTLGPLDPASPDPLDDQIRGAALATAYDLTWARPPLDEEVGAPVVPRTDPPAVAPAPTPAPGAPAPTGEVPPVRATRPERMRFTAWLEGGPAEPSTGTGPSAGHNVQRPGSPVLPKASAPSNPSGAVDTKALIERFIQGQTPPAPRKAEFYTPQQAAKRSLEEHAELVTETLARIYEQQGDLARAAAAYRRLAERHPQRREEFLARAVAAERSKG